MDDDRKTDWLDPHERGESENHVYSVSVEYIYVKAANPKPTKIKSSHSTWILVLGLIALTGGPLFLFVWPGLGAIQRFIWPVPVGELGTPTTYSDYALTVNKLERGSTFNNSQAKAGKEFVLLDVTYQSGGDENVSSNLFFEHAWLKDGQGFLYDGEDSPLQPALRSNSGTLSKGTKQRGWLAFQVPTGATGLVLDFPLSRGFNKKSPLRMSVRLDAQAQVNPPPSLGQAVGSKGQTGQIVGGGSYLLVVNSVVITDQLQTGLSNLKKTSANKKWVLLDLTFQSNDNNGVYVNASSANLKDADNFTYKVTYGIYQPELPAIGPVPKGYRVRGWVAFEVPIATQNFTLEYRTNNNTRLSVKL